MIFGKRSWVKDRRVNPAIQQSAKYCLVYILRVLKLGYERFARGARVWQQHIVEKY